VTEVCLLGFGSSARRGQRPWTDRASVRRILDVCQPDRTVDGESPSGGADELFHEEARAHFLAVGLGALRAQRCPVSTALDGRWPGAGPRRNARLFRTHRPTLAAGFVAGVVRSPMSSGSAHMASICLRGLPDVPPCALVIVREDGVEPCADVTAAYQQLRRLWAATRDERLVPAAWALLALRAGQTSPDEALAALGCAREGSRWAPWLEAVEGAVRA